MNRWKGIVEFVSVVEAGSFSKAADNLGIAVSQVSKRIADLEARLGTRLIHRSTRLVKPSKQGEIYYESCKKIIAEFERAEDKIAVQQDGAQGSLKICMVGGSRPALQVELLASFLKKYPEITAEVIYTDELPNLLEEGIDVVLGIGETDHTVFPKIRVAWVDYFLFASPDFLAEYGEPKEPQSLEDIPCIVNDSNIWRLSDGDRHVEVDVSGPWKSLNMRSCIQACTCGLGVFMLASVSIEEEVSSGRLMPILKDWRIRKPMWLMFPQLDYVPVKVNLLKDFIADVAGLITSGVETNVAPSFNLESKKLFTEFTDSLKREDPQFSE